MNCGHLFNGIGGFALAAHWMGWNNVMHCEIDPFCNKVMNRHFPNSFQHEDIRTTDFTIWRGKIDIITGGFPCQPYSTAGKRKGKDDDRHLWPEMLRAIREIQPSWIVGENVRGLTNWNGGLVFDEVQADLEAEGYEVLPFLLPACGVNAPHRRDRIWFIANRPNARTESMQQGRQNAAHEPGITSDPNGGGHRCNDKLGKVGCPKEEAEGEEQREEWNEIQWQRDRGNPRGANATGVAADTARFGEREQANEVDALPTNRETRAEFGCVSRGGVITDAHGKQRCEGGLYENGSEEAAGYTGSCDARDVRTDWKDFPTQPPLCTRNDGLSTRLDGIGLSRWRKESIKAAGNAIVPQVAYKIFKAIEAFSIL